MDSGELDPSDWKGGMNSAYHRPEEGDVKTSRIGPFQFLRWLAREPHSVPEGSESNNGVFHTVAVCTQHPSGHFDW